MELNKWYKSEEIDDFKTKRVRYFKPEYVDDLMGFYQGLYVREVEYNDGDICLDINQNSIYIDEANKYSLINDAIAQEEIHFIIEKTEEKLFY